MENELSMNGIENSELIKAIQNYEKSSSIKDEGILKDAISKAKFLAPVRLGDGQEISQGEQVLKEATNFNLINIVGYDGDIYLPAFTSWAEVNKWRTEQDVKIISFTLEDYVYIFLGEEDMKGIVINPYGENLVIDKQQIMSMDNDSSGSDEIVKVGIPVNYPVKLVENLKRFMLSDTTISEAYLLLMVQGEEQSYLLVIATDEDVNILYPRLSEVASKYLSADEAIDFISSKEEFAQSAIKNQAPFYKREVEELMIRLTLDNDEEVECVVLEIFEVQEQEYIALLPLKGGNEESKPLFYRFRKVKGEGPILSNIEDDKEYEAVVNIFEELFQLEADISTVTLTLDNDEEVECAVLTTFRAQEQEYIALLPFEENESDEEVNPFIYRFKEIEGEEPELSNIENEEEYRFAKKVLDEWLNIQDSKVLSPLM